MNLKIVIGIIIIVVFVIFGALSFRKTLTPYVSFEEAKRTDASVQVIGKVVPQESLYDTTTHLFHFALRSPEGEILNVVFDGTKPANFEQATDVVAIGRYRNGRFEADQVLVKCPSKYQGSES
jgi:cytochrome c-type biogenesis protein CcmE